MKKDKRQKHSKQHCRNVFKTLWCHAQDRVLTFMYLIKERKKCHHCFSWYDITDCCYMLCKLTKLITIGVANIVKKYEIWHFFLWQYERDHFSSSFGCFLAQSFESIQLADAFTHISTSWQEGNFSCYSR